MHLFRRFSHKQEMKSEIEVLSERNSSIGLIYRKSYVPLRRGRRLKASWRYLCTSLFEADPEIGERLTSLHYKSSISAYRCIDTAHFE